MRGYPRWFPRLLGLTVATLSVTGLLLGTGTLELRADLPLGWHVSGAGRTWSTAFHAAGGFLMMSFCGALWSIHMRAGWRRREHQTSGLTLAVLLPALAATAVGIYYSGDEALGDVLSYVHLGAGLIMVGLLVQHWVTGRQLRRQHSHR